MKKVSKTAILVAYAVVIFVFGVLGYLVGHKQGKAEMYASIGVIIGAILCVILWFAWGKSHAIN